MSITFKKFFTLIMMLSFFCFTKAESLEVAKNPQITLHEYGSHIYAIWAKNDGTNDIIRAAYSSDFGTTWSSPISLSDLGQNALTPQIIDNDRQSHIYAVWSRSNGTNNIIQFDASRNFFATWNTATDLSQSGQNASNPQIVTDQIGKGIYSLWIRSNGTNDIVQFVRSIDFGQNFSIPIDLSDAGRDASNAKFAIRNSRRCICTIWQRSNGTKDVIQFRHSNDKGETFEAIQDLSDVNQNAKTPDIIVQDYVIYATWVRSNGTNDLVQCRYSTDNSTTWSNVQDLSAVGQNAKDPKIVSDFSGRFAYIAWIRSNGTNDIVQISSTNDYGVTWSAPIDLSAIGQNTKEMQLTTSNSGQCIYVIWTRSNGTNDIIQLSYSTDYGLTWATPIDLSVVGQNAKNPQIITSLPGMDVYAIWARSNGTKDVIELSYTHYYGSSWTTPVTLSN